MTEREIYVEAARISEQTEQQAFLDDACGGDGVLRQRVERLLAARAEQGSNLLVVAAPATASGSFNVDRLGSTIASANSEKSENLSDLKIGGRYKPIEELGQGGMGTVYMAEQRQPVRRKVALKVIKRGMDSEQVVARFEAERQALALMNHPNIAGVLDAGMTDDGRPFFVMELVRGIPITEYCDRHKLNRDERLRLFKSVCDAVQHAHQKGVIHRDLKPSNILVELHDVNHVPKVIDFGVAKATSQRLTDKTLYTLFSQMIGTPLYMSPEQAELSGLDVDTRSDIYSLGVLLYELLTGTTPFDRETFKTASLDEMRRIIREDEPLRPSHKISTLDKEQISTIAERQGTDVRSLTGKPVKELDWIVVKTLEKDRSRRYESASALANDIQRFIDNEPVLACPPSLGYRLSKFASKRKGLLVSAALIFLSLMAATTVSLWSAANARSAALASEESARLADQRFHLALESVDKFLSEVTDNEELKNESLESLRLSLLQSAIPFLEQLVAAESADTGALAAKAEALLRLGQIQSEIGNPSESLQILDGIPPIIATVTVTVGERDVFRELEAQYFSTSATAYSVLGDYQKALDLHQESVRLQTELVEKSSSIERQAVLGEFLYRTANAANNFDRTEAALEFSDRAIAVWEKLCRQKTDDAQYLRHINKSRIIKANALQLQLDYEAALAENEKAVQGLTELAARFPGDERIQDSLKSALFKLGLNLEALGRFEDAIERFQKGLILDRAYLEKFPEKQDSALEWALTARTLATALRREGRVEESIAQLQEVIDLLTPLAPNYVDTAGYYFQLSAAYQGLAKANEMSGNLTSAQLYFDKAVQQVERLVEQHPDIPRFRDALAEKLLSFAGFLFGKQQYESAAQQLSRAIEVMQPLIPLIDSRPAYGRRLASLHNNLGVLMQRLKRDQEKQFHWQKQYELLEQLATNNPDDPGIRLTQAMVAGNRGDGNLSLQLLEALMRDFPEAKLQYATNHASVLHQLGDQKGRSFTERRDLYRRAVGSLREYLTAYPKEISVRLDMAVYLNDLVISNAQALKGESVESTVQESIDAFTSAARDSSPADPRVIEVCRACISDLAKLLNNSKTRPYGQIGLQRWSEALVAFSQASSRYEGLIKVIQTAQAPDWNSDIALLLEQEKLEFLETAPEANAKQIADSLNRLGMMYLDNRDYDSARSTLERAVAVSTKAYGARHRSTLSHAYDLGRLESAVKEHNAALSIFRSVLEKRSDVLGIEHFDTFKAEERVFLTLSALERFEEARDLMQERELLQNDAGKQDLRRSAFRLMYIAAAEADLKNFDDATAAYAKSDALYQELESHAATLDRLLMLNKYGMLLKNLRRHDNAIQVFKEIIAIRERMQEDRPTYLFNRSMLGGAHGNLSNVFVSRKEYAKAIEQLEQAEAVFAAILSENPNDRLTQKFQASVLRNMATCYEYSDMPEISIRYFERACAVCVDEQKREINLRYALARIRFAAKSLEGGSFSEPVEIALKYLDSDKDDLEDEELLSAANILAISANSDPSLNDEQRQLYRQAAVRALIQAAEMGYFATPSNLDDFRVEEFASLNDDPRFKELLNEYHLVRE